MNNYKYTVIYINNIQIKKIDTLDLVVFLSLTESNGLPLTRWMDG